MIAQARPSLAPALRGSQARQDGDVLTLEVPPDFHTFATLHLDEYRELARKVAGRNLKVQISATAAPVKEKTGDAPSSPPPEDDAKRQRMLADASREPAVQEALDLFNGKVVDVRES
jgi:hypothetical protein